jgi:hypothetical protein
MILKEKVKLIRKVDVTTNSGEGEYIYMALKKA